MTTTHTPGPWYATATSSDQGLIISESSGANIAITYDPKDRHVIAAATDMLEALEALMNYNVFTKEDRALAQAALNKAYGED
jgi:hypothetical protein